jgi:Ca2+-binding EF-hand superfamily protein
MSWKLTVKDIDEYKAAFAVCDKDHDGKISAAEMGNIMRTLGKNFSDKEFNEIIHEIETKENGYLELDKFLNLMADIKTDENSLKIEQTNLINAFAYFDRDQTGFIDYEEFKHILTTVSEKLSPKEVQKLDELCRSSVNENGQFRYKDFLELILLR